MNITQIEEIVKKLVCDVNAASVNKDEFIYQLMAAYGLRKTTIGRIKSGERNLADAVGEVRAKIHVYFKHSQSNNVLSDIDSMKKRPSIAREKIRFVIATDFNQFVALDTRTNDTLDIKFNDLGKHFDFFLYWAGIEKALYKGENPADVKAAEKMGDLFDLIKADNFNDENKDDTQALHNLNVFLTRLLFCFFAEDTGIFKQNQFSGELESHTKVDGSDVAEYLNRLFEVLNTPKDKRADLPDYLANFEFVNGGLFADCIESPKFSTKSRKMLIESGSELDWSDINPDIFGSMIQAVVHPDQRGNMGMHYTSVTNIMKVIEPLFLDELYAELENIEDNIDPKLKPSRLRKLHDRISEMKIFDPACGSGNFLIIAFKELRKLEMEIIKRLQELDQNENQDDLFGDVGLDSSFSRIKLSQFYGIELDDFAHEVAILSLWLAEHQMNVEFKAEFGECEPTLPLQQSGNIICGNATKIDWEDVCARTDSVFMIGNPPYIGFQNQTDTQKSEIKSVFKKIKNFKRIDYIGVWFYKAASFISGYNSSFAFVSTNSICQGEQVRIIWPYIFSNELEIAFAYQPFNWSNNAKNKAKVTCVIVGVKNKKHIKNKIIYTNLIRKIVSNISPYLIEGSPVAIEPLSAPLSNLPKMSIGNVPLDGNNFILNEEEKEELLASAPQAKNFVKYYMGASDFIKGNKRYCIWVTDETKEQAVKVPFINERIERCRVFRKSGGIVARQHEKVSHRFRTQPHRESNSIIFPKTSSSRRKYIPVGFLDRNTVISEKALAAYGAEPYLFGILSSRMHVLWLSITSSRMRNDFQYSVQFSYNTFPVPELSEENKQNITQASIEIIETRELFPDKNLAVLYDPLKMPKELLAAHENLDTIVDKIYSQSPFKSDEERLQKLFKMYSEMTGGQNA